MYTTYESVDLAGDYNVQAGEKLFDTFLYQRKLTSINKNPTCYKNPSNPSCIDPVLNKSPKIENVFTGHSYFCKLVLSVFNLHFSKAKAKEIPYIDFKDFKEDNFNWDLQNRLSAESVEEYSPCEKTFLDVLSKHDSLKKKVVCVNHRPYITKILKKAIMKQSYLEKVYFKKRTPDTLIHFKKQNKYCSRLYEKEGLKYFESFNPRRISDHKSFWKNMGKISNKITLVDNKENTIFEGQLVSE